MGAKKLICYILILSIGLSACNNGMNNAGSIDFASHQSVTNMYNKNMNNDTILVAQSNTTLSYFDEVGESKEAIAIYNAKESKLFLIGNKTGLQMLNNATLTDDIYNDIGGEKISAYIKDNMNKFIPILANNGNVFKPDNRGAIFYDSTNQRLFWLEYDTNNTCFEYVWNINSNNKPEIYQTITIKGQVDGDKFAAFADTGVKDEYSIKLSYVSNYINEDGETNKTLTVEDYPANIYEYDLPNKSLLQVINSDAYQPATISATTASNYKFTGKPTIQEAAFIKKYFPQSQVGENPSTVEPNFWDNAFSPSIIVLSVVSALLSAVSFIHGSREAAQSSREYFKTDIRQHADGLIFSNEVNNTLLQRATVIDADRIKAQVDLSNDADIKHFVKDIEEYNTFLFKENSAEVKDLYNNLIPDNFNINYKNISLNVAYDKKKHLITINNKSLTPTSEYFDVLKKYFYNKYSRLINNASYMNIEYPISHQSEQKVYFDLKYGKSTPEKYLADIANDLSLNSTTDSVTLNSSNIISRKYFVEITQKYKTLGSMVIKNIDGVNQYSFIFSTISAEPAERLNQFKMDYINSMTNDIQTDIYNRDAGITKKGKNLGILFAVLAAVGTATVIGKEYNIYSVGCGQYFCDIGTLVNDGQASDVTSKYVAKDMVLQSIPFINNNKQQYLRVMQNFSMSCDDMLQQLPDNLSKNFYAISRNNEKYLVSDVNNNICQTTTNINDFIEPR